jgi:hypothetical protein
VVGAQATQLKSRKKCTRVDVLALTVDQGKSARGTVRILLGSLGILLVLYTNETPYTGFVAAEPVLQSYEEPARRTKQFPWTAQL